MKFKRCVILFFFLLGFLTGFSQVKDKTSLRILFRGIVLDAEELAPVPNTQIMINKIFSSVSVEDGSFTFYANRKDTVVFRSLGYKPETLSVSDTLKAVEFIVGIYLQKDTMSIGEVVIVPRNVNLKSEILNSPSKTPQTFENARYNVAVSAYQGKTSTGSLGTPGDNYAILNQKQKINSFERGGIPSENTVALNPFILIPAAYLLFKGIPEKPASYRPTLSGAEIEQVNNAYLEKLRKRK
jgi:hypothetical protein